MNLQDMTSYSTAENKRVYINCRAIFSGSHAQLRRRKKIRELVERHASSLTVLTRDFEITELVDILRALLRSGIFESEARARIEFPDLFHSSQDRHVQHAESEQNAARSVAEALDEIASLGELRDEPDQRNPERCEPAQNVNPCGSAPSLYPSYLPYKAQHIILTTAQSMLEQSCYEFVSKWIPTALNDRGWDCAESGELTKWTRILLKHSETLPDHAFAVRGTLLKDILVSVHRLRHTAVHRLPTTARGISELIQSAMKFTEALGDSIHTSQLEEMNKEIQSKIKAMELNKNALEDILNNELRKLRRQREELDMIEKELVASTMREDLENKSLMGSLLEDSVRRILSKELEPRVDLDDCREDYPESKMDEDLEELNDTTFEVIRYNASNNAEHE